MDKALKDAIDQGRAAKERKDREARKALEEAQAEHQKYIKSHLPSARKWIKDVLFSKIAQEEASGHTYRSIYLGSGNVDGIPAEAIYEAAKKIKGLKPTYDCPLIYENAECVGVDDPIYKIGWESTDPNDNRNDR